MNKNVSRPIYITHKNKIFNENFLYFGKPIFLFIFVRPLTRPYMRTFVDKDLWYIYGHLVYKDLCGCHDVYWTV